DAVAASAALDTGGKRLRMSTCFLVDDYFSRFSSPADVVPALLAEAERAGLAIDYLVRESGCAEADGFPLARSVAHRLVESPPRGSTGVRPPVTETGWIANGSRSPVAGAAPGWRPPHETAARRHSVFLDIELWDGEGPGQTFSCAFLAAVWQLLRLGLLRNDGRPVLRPRLWDGGGFPQDWDDLPPLLQLNPAAPPFAAYRTCSLLPSRYLPVEHAVLVLPTARALRPSEAAELLRLRLDEPVRVSRRPNLHVVSPPRLTGVDCALPTDDGSKVRGIGTVISCASVTEGHVLQVNAYTGVTAAGPDARRPWGHYLSRPGVTEPLGKLPEPATARGFLAGSRETGLDPGLLAESLLTE